MQIIRRLNRLLFIMTGFLMYALGVGVARYVGQTLNVELLLLGLAWAILLQMSALFLKDFFNAPPDFGREAGKSDPEGKPGFKLQKRHYQWIVLGLVAALASITVLMIDRGAPGLSYLLMGLAFTGALFYAAPVMPLETSGFGELVEAIGMVYLLPAYAFLLQAGEMSRLIAMSTLFLAPLYMGWRIAAELPEYANDLRTGRGVLMVRAGWERGMLLHNILILGAYLVLAIGAVFGLPMFVFIPAILTLPLGLFQVWQVWRIGGGGRPNWSAVTLIGMLVFFIPAYLVVYSFWTH